MSISTTIPKAVGRRRSRPLATITAIAAVLALTACAIAIYAVGSATRSARSSAATEASVLRQLSPTGREYVVGIMSMTPVEVRAAFGTGPTSAQGRHGASTAQVVHSGAPTLATVLRSLTARERRYVLGIAALTPLQLWGAFGTSPTPPPSRRHRQHKTAQRRASP